MKEPVVTIERINAAVAISYLDRNEGNRPLNMNTVSLYTQRMERGEFVLSNDAITFDAEGRLLNGQHRLKAVVQSDTDQPFLVLRGVPADTFTVMDDGKKRTPGDVLAITGIRGAIHMASTVRTVLLLRARKRTHNCGALSYRYSNEQIRMECMRDLKGYAAANDAGAACYRKLKIYSQSYYAGVMYYLSHDMGYSITEVEGFFRRLCGLTPTMNETVNRLRDVMINNMTTKGQTMTALKRDVFLIKTWNAYVEGRTVKQLKFIPEIDSDIWFSKNE